MAVVSQLWRYPAKSMIGESLDHATLAVNGVLGDRGWAIRDEVRGGIRGAKKIGPLMKLAARYLAEPDGTLPPPPVEIRLPDGSTLRSDDPAIHQQLSKALDHSVTLWPLQPADDKDHYRRGAPDSDDLMTELRSMFGRIEDEPLPDLMSFPSELFEYESPLGTYFDAYPILIVTTASLRSLASLAPSSRFDVRRFRPNIVIDLGDVDGEPFPEQAWIGQQLQVGAVGLDVVSTCPRCVMVTRGFDDLPEDRTVLRTIVREADQNVGVYATVAAPGTARVGDPVAVGA